MYLPNNFRELTILEVCMLINQVQYLRGTLYLHILKLATSRYLPTYIYIGMYVGTHAGFKACFIGNITASTCVEKHIHRMYYAGKTALFYDIL